VGFDQVTTDATEPAGKTWTATVLGSPSGVIKLRAQGAGDELAPGEQVTAAAMATFCTSGSSTWTTAAKESIDFTTGDFANSGTEPPLQVNAGSATSLTLAAATATPTAGVADNLTITAKDGCGNTATSYTGTKDLTFGGASAAPDGTQPTVTSNNGTATDFGQNTNIDFINGVATVSGSNNGVMTLYKKESTTITVSDGTLNNGSGLAVTVSPGALGALTITNPTPPLTAGVDFDVTVAAFDLFENPGADGYWNGPGCVRLLEFRSPPPAEKPADDPAPGGCPFTDPSDLPSELAFDASGEATANITLYRATTTFTVPSTQTVTVKAYGGPDAPSDATDPLTVNPGTDLFRFRWTDEPLASQTAGQVFDRVEVSAYDEWDNIKTDYNPAGAVFSGLGTSPLGNAPVYGFSWANGIAVSTTMTDYKAETTSLAVTDGSVNASSSGFTVAPGPLDHFTWTDQPNAAQTAGATFDSVAVTAYDAYGNLKTNYSPPASPFSGLGTSPSGCNVSGTLTPGGTFGCPPVYGFTWSAGVATSTTVTDYKAEATSLTVTDGSINASSSGFTVVPNVAAVPPTRFNVPPTLTERGQTINDASPGVQVTVEDAYGNPRSGDSVTVALGTNPSSGTLAGTLTRTTNTSGVATFDNLSINNSGIGYTLVATTGSASKTSNAFDIANDVTLCEATGTCSATGSTSLGSATVDAFGVGTGALSSRLGSASAASPTSSRLGMTVASSVPVPPSLCGGTARYGDGFWITTVQSSTAKPSFKVVAKLAKSEVNRKPGNPGATKFDICLGAKNTSPGTLLDGCSSPTNSKSWKTKDGSCAVFDPATGLYWGLVADYQSKVKSCPTGINSNLFPGVLSKMKTGAGDVVITFCKPYPWDGGGGWR
jgi:hypothetical protein